MANQTLLNEQCQELIAVGASIAAGCVPCTNFHLKAARMAGASPDEIGQAVDLALRVRQRATKVMARFGGERPQTIVADDAIWSDRLAISALVSVGAAYAVNCTATLENCIHMALQQGVTGGQILEALKIACAVKSMAGRKVQAAAARALGAEGNESDACACEEQPDEHVAETEPAQAAETAKPCSGDCSCQN